MNDIIIITTYNRVDYLRLCLEYLSKAEGVQNKTIWLCIDRGKALYRDFAEVVADFRGVLRIETFIRPDHTYFGNTYNTMEAYREAFETSARYIYLVEDDVLVQPDFFRWHESIQSTVDCMCSIAYRCYRNSGTFIGLSDPEAYFTTLRDYASIGVCWRRERLEPVVKHARVEYYQNQKAYLRQTFPKNRFADCFSEQDGLIMRVLGEQHALPVIWPYLPRCYHIGFAGYNRPNGPRLSYSELKEIIHDPHMIMVKNTSGFNDIEPIPTTVPDWAVDKLHKVQHFE